MFAIAIADADFFAGFARAVVDWKQRLQAHPRPGPPFRLRATAEELANRAVRMFREQYRPNPAGVALVGERPSDPRANLKELLQRNRALSEVKLQHPVLPFLGLLDRVQVAPDGIEIVDFKTGRPSETHHRQLLRYALLWARATGDVPVRVTAQYLDGAEAWPVGGDDLEEVEADLSTMMQALTDALRARPAEGKPGVGCQTCHVRARCDAGWVVGEEAARIDGRGDAEVVITAKAGDHGFLARLRSGAEVAVVYEAPVARLLPECAVAQVVRILDGEWKDKRSQLEIKPWTQVFAVLR